MHRRSLIAYFVVLILSCAAVVLGARLLGRQGAYLGQVYMLTPAFAAIVTRLFFYPPRFGDAGLRIGRPADYFRYWILSLGIVALYFISYTLLNAVTWDLTGDIFLARLAQQFADAGQDMNAVLPAGFTARTMLYIYFVGGLTLFNVFPGLITGFGEEFGHRGFMFPQLYRIRPWVGLFVGGLLWFAWHWPLALVFPQSSSMETTVAAINFLLLAAGAICTFIFLAYVYIRTGSIFVASLAHITMNNASQSLSYFAVLHNQVLANAGTVAVMLMVVIVLQLRGDLRIFSQSLGDGGGRASIPDKG